MGVVKLPRGCDGITALDVPGHGTRIAAHIQLASSRCSRLLPETYDLYLSRTVQYAELVRAPTSAAAVDVFIEQGLDAVAGVRDYLQTRISEQWRVVEDDFMTIHQAMAVPVAHAAAAAFVRSFVERQKLKGGVRRGLLASGQSAELQAA